MFGGENKKRQLNWANIYVVNIKLLRKDKPRVETIALFIEEIADVEIKSLEEDR